MKTFDGREKSLLRAATADVLPRSVVERRRAPTPPRRIPLRPFLRRQLAEVLEDRDAPVRPLLDPVQARALVAQEDDGSMAGRTSLEQTLILNNWLVDYGVSLRSSSVEDPRPAEEGPPSHV